MGEPELEDPIVTGVPLLEIKGASHTLGGVKVQADVANAHSVNVCVGGRGLEKPFCTTPPSVNKSAMAIQIEKRHQKELPQASLIKNTLLRQSKELEGFLPSKPWKKRQIFTLR